MSDYGYEQMGKILPNIKPDFKEVEIAAKSVTDVAKKGGKDLALKKLIDVLPIPDNHKKVLKWFSGQQVDYIAWCASKGKTPYTRPSLIAYMGEKAPKVLADSAKSFGDYTRQQNIMCVSTIAVVVIDFRSRLGMVRGGVIGATAGIGLLILDVLEIANSCEFVQEGYYDLFLKSSDIHLKPTARKDRMSVAQPDIYQIIKPTVGTAHSRMMCGF